MYDENTESDYGPETPGAKELKQNHPELYGRLLIANEQISESGVTLFFVGVMLWVGSCVAIHQAWLDGIAGIPLAKLQSLWVYIGFAILLGGAVLLFNQFRQPMIYRRHKQLIETEVGRIDRSLPWLVTQINDEPQLSSIAEQLRNDATL